MNHLLEILHYENNNPSNPNLDENMINNQGLQSRQIQHICIIFILIIFNRVSIL